MAAFILLLLAALVALAAGATVVAVSRDGYRRAAIERPRSEYLRDDHYRPWS